MSEQHFSPEIKEGVPLSEVWIIDDEEEITQTLLRIWGRKFAGKYVLRNFYTAQEALGEIERLAKEKGILPKIIFVDGQLKKDQGELAQGDVVIQKIRALKDISQPQLIAHSAVGEINKEMIEAGADLSFRKSLDFMKLSKFLEDPEEYKEEEKK